MRKIYILAIVAALALQAVVFAQSPQFLATPKGHMKMDASLSQLADQYSATGDASSFARQHGLYVQGGYVRVVIELVSDNVGLPSGYDIKIETRHGNTVQALVAISDLTALADSPQVQYIYVPMTVVQTA